MALYLFTECTSLQKEIIDRISFGGGCINDTIYHLTHPDLPFGGVGESGIGKYHGEHSFRTFSHQKAVLKQTTKFDIPARYTKTDEMLKIMKKLLK